MTRHILPTSLLLLGALAAPAAAATTGSPSPLPEKPVSKTVTLRENAVQRYSMTLTDLGQAANVLLPCWGFRVSGPGVETRGANLPIFGEVMAEPEAVRRGEADGGIDGAQESGGKYVVPESAAAFTPAIARRYDRCVADGWIAGDTARAARRRKSRAKARRASGSSGVRVRLAGLEPIARRVTVEVATGDLRGATRLTMFARIGLQG